MKFAYAKMLTEREEKKNFIIKKFSILVSILLQMENLAFKFLNSTTPGLSPLKSTTSGLSPLHTTTLNQPHHLTNLNPPHHLTTLNPPHHHLATPNLPHHHLTSPNLPHHITTINPPLLPHFPLLLLWVTTFNHPPPLSNLPLQIINLPPHNLHHFSNPKPLLQQTTTNPKYQTRSNQINPIYQTLQIMVNRKYYQLQNHMSR